MIPLILTFIYVIKSILHYNYLNLLQKVEVDTKNCGFLWMELNISSKYFNIYTIFILLLRKIISIAAIIVCLNYPTIQIYTLMGNSFVIVFFLLVKVPYSRTLVFLSHVVSEIITGSVMVYLFFLKGAIDQNNSDKVIDFSKIICLLVIA